MMSLNLSIIYWTLESLMERKWISRKCNDKQPSAGICIAHIMTSNKLQIISSFAANQLFPHSKQQSNSFSTWENGVVSSLACWGQDQNKITQHISICYGREAVGVKSLPPSTNTAPLIYDSLILPTTMEMYPAKMQDFLFRDYCESQESYIIQIVLYNDIFPRPDEIEFSLSVYNPP